LNKRCKKARPAQANTLDAATPTLTRNHADAGVVMNLSTLSLTSPKPQQQQPPVVIKAVATEGLGGPTARNTKPPVVAAPPDVVAPVPSKPVLSSFSSVLSQAHQAQPQPTVAAHALRADERQPPQQDTGSKAPPRTITGSNTGSATSSTAGPKNTPRPTVRNPAEKPVAATPVRGGGDKTKPVVDEATPTESTTPAEEAQDQGDELAALLAGLPNPLHTPSGVEAGASSANTLPLDETKAGTHDNAALGAAAERSAKLAATGLRGAAGLAAADDAAKPSTDAAASAPADWLATLQSAEQAASAAQSAAAHDGQGAAAGESAAAAVNGNINSNNNSTDSTALLVNTSAGLSLGAAAAGASTGVANASGHISAHPSSADFAPQLGAQLSSFVKDGVQHALLELNPAEMGPLTLQIQLDGNAATVNLSAENAITREALEKAMPVLASNLREAGLTLSGGGVFEQSRQATQQGGQDASQGHGQRSSARGANNTTAGNDGLVGAPLQPLRPRGVVDLVA
jgi:flagellar hook-length control protein FliK